MADIFKTSANTQMPKQPVSASQSGLKSQTSSQQSRKTSYPLQITILNGAYKGKSLKIGEWLGTGVEETSHKSGADWSPVDAKGIRNSASFKKLADRTFSLKLTFYDYAQDVSQLVENLQVLTQITDGEVNPPSLTYQQGKLVATPVVCQNISTSYKSSHGLDFGYMYAEVDLEFLLIGGRSSEHALSAPLAPTPLADIRNAETKQEREKKGTLAVTEKTLAPCLGSQGNAELQSLITNDNLKNKDEIAKLSPETFVQIAIAGMIPPEILVDASIKSKLNRDLAKVLASKEEGIVTDSSIASFEKALLNNSTSELPAELQSQGEEALADYHLMLEAIASQDLNDSSKIFTQAHQQTGNKIRKIGGCGISLRKVNAGSTVGDSIDRDRITLAKLKIFLEKVNKGEIKDADAKIALGVTKDADLKSIKNGAPYKTKKEFLDRINKNGSLGLTSQSVWGTFTKYDLPDTSANPETEVK